MLRFKKSKARLSSIESQPKKVVVIVVVDVVVVVIFIVGFVVIGLIVVGLVVVFRDLALKLGPNLIAEICCCCQAQPSSIQLQLSWLG